MVTVRKRKVVATVRQKRAVDNLVVNGGNVSKAMRDAGYTKLTAKTPQKLTESRGFKGLIEDAGLTDQYLLRKHKELMDSKRIEHMTFPLRVSDDDIRELLESVSCIVRRIQRSAKQVDCWYWASNTEAVKGSLELAYKIKRHFGETPNSISFNQVTLMVDEKKKDAFVERMNQMVIDEASDD